MSSKAKTASNERTSSKAVRNEDPRKGTALNKSKSYHGKKSQLTLSNKKDANEGTDAANNANLTKSVIETSLFKSADVLSDFTENTILQSAAGKKQVMGDRFGNKFHQSRKSQRVAIASEHIQRTKPDISKFPESIATLLKDDSNSSIISRDRKYHTKKLALRQGAVSSHGGVTSALNTCSKVSKIVVISTPLQLESHITPKSSTHKLDNENGHMQHSNLRHGRKDPLHDSPVVFKNVSRRPVVTGDKPDKRIGVGGAYMASVKKSQKVQVGVKNGAPFILRIKAKRQHVNSFGNVVDLGNYLNPSNRKWSVNIGNFLDNEISFELAENCLKIIGFRQPTLKFPEGQTTSEEVTMPPNFDIHDLRIYRAVDANEVLVLEEIQTK